MYVIIVVMKFQWYMMILTSIWETRRKPLIELSTRTENNYPLESSIAFRNTYLVDRADCGEWTIPTHGGRKTKKNKRERTQIIKKQ